MNPRLLFHTLHSCGHAVYWENPKTGRYLASWPCPWCGGETGLAKDTVPADIAIIRLNDFSHCLKTLERGIPPEWGDMVGVRHETGERCCGGKPQ